MLRAPIWQAGSTRRGMVAAQIVLTLSALIAMLAVVADGGLLLAERRQAQAAADAGAMAAASGIYNPSSSGPSAATVVNDNYPNGTTPTVTVNIPPSSGNFVGQAGYAEVIVTRSEVRLFSLIFGNSAIPVTARAVARGLSSTGSGSPAILLLGSGNNISDITANGNNATVTVTGILGSLYLDSMNNPATLNGSKTSVTAPYVDAADSSLSPKVQATQGAVTLNAPQLSDPLSYLPDPPSNSGVSVNSTYASSGITGSATLSSNTIYIVGGSGINLSGQASVTGTNVMIYLSGSAGVSLAGQASVNLSPLSTGPYAGMSIFQSRGDSTAWAVTGNGTLNATGTIYAPAARIVTSGNGGNVASQIIASSMTMNGNGDSVAYSQTAGNHTATRLLGLVE